MVALVCACMWACESGGGTWGATPQQVCDAPDRVSNTCPLAAWGIVSYLPASLMKLNQEKVSDLKPESTSQQLNEQ